MKYIWTYSAGVFEYTSRRDDCPCNGGAPPPAFVGSDYYCESAISAGNWGSTIYPDDPLWDGQDCRGLERTCCDSPNLPWFCKELPQSTTDYLEIRICSDEVLSNEDTLIDLVQLYIQ